MRRIGGVLVFGVFALVIAAFVPVSRLGYTCVMCRLGRVDATCLGIVRSTYDENECSRWYSSHVESVHVHVWERGTCQSTSNLLGTPIRVGCRPGHYPIQLLSPSTQMQVYQHFKDPLEARALFESLTDEKTYDDRLDEDSEDRGHIMVRAIQAWEAEGFPGTWADWWARSYAAHVKEHKEWRIWLHADSNMNFWDWQKQRKKVD